jgi:hypothetical protein
LQIFFVEEDKTYIRIVYKTRLPYEEEIREKGDYFIMKVLRQDDRDCIILGSNFERTRDAEEMLNVAQVAPPVTHPQLQPFSP